MKQKLLQLALAASSLLLVQPINGWAQDKPVQPCQARPQKDQPPQSDGSSDMNRARDCNGVLRPPEVGDPELVKPAPDIGKMPVIPPGSVPENGSGSNGQGKAQ